MSDYIPKNAGDLAWAGFWIGAGLAFAGWCIGAAIDALANQLYTLGNRAVDAFVRSKGLKR